MQLIVKEIMGKDVKNSKSVGNNSSEGSTLLVEYYLSLQNNISTRCICEIEPLSVVKL